MVINNGGSIRINMDCDNNSPDGESFAIGKNQRSIDANNKLFEVLETGTVVLPFGQIQFPATQNASTNANTLDDYEEGTWTATWTSATPPTTPPTATGAYTKIGRVVTISVFFENVNTTGGSGLMSITGLPFPVGATLNSRGSGAVNFFGISFAGSYCVAEASESAIYFRTITTNAAWADLSMTAGSGKYVTTTLTYIV